VNPTRRLAALFLGLAVLLVALPAGAEERALPAFKAIDSMEARVQGCVTCHGQSGEGTSSDYFPRIAGKPAGYLFNQLVAFRDGKRKYAPMNYLVAYLPDPYLREMAEHFSKLRPPFDTSSASAAAPADTARGKVIALAGDPANQVPACIACHGAGLTGTDPGIPGLVGLRPAYIAGQLTRWRVGARTAAEPDCMKRIATRLSESDVAAVAAWLGMQAAPSDPSPLPPGSIRMPLACGSQK
jgi:cytochrome c553